MLVACLEKVGVRMPGANCDRSTIFFGLVSEFWIIPGNLHLVDPFENTTKD